MKRLAFLLVFCCLLTSMQGQSAPKPDHTAQSDFHTADAELNKVYQQALLGLGPKRTAALKEAQRAWIVFRDKSAEAYSTNEQDGTLAKLLSIDCRTTLTRERISDLRKMYLSGGETF